MLYLAVHNFRDKIVLVKKSLDMLLYLSLFKFKKKFIVVFVVLLSFITLVYIYLNYLQHNYNDVQLSGERCISELRSIKYQLNVVTEYKNRIDKLLTETQKAHTSDKEKFKDVMESCVAMKQQSSICQSQFEDLQLECKRVREDYDQVLQELKKLKTLR